MNTFSRVDQWFLQKFPKDAVQGYLQVTQAMAIHAILKCQWTDKLHGALAEVGIFHGKTLIGLARAAQPDERVIGVDPLKIGAADLAPILQKNMTLHLTSAERDQLQILRQLSTDLNVADWMRALDKPARFIHLDGHHARETMLHDLRLAASSLAVEGVIVIDDFLNELHPDLTAGILDALAVQTNLEAVAVIPRMGHIEEGGSKLICTTKGHAARYVAALDAALGNHLRPWKDALLGKPVRVYRSSMPVPMVASAVKKEAAALPVVFALHDADGQYWLNVAVAIASVGQHASVPVHFHILHNETLHTVAQKRLQSIAQSVGAQISFVHMVLPPNIKKEQLRRFSPASLYRLMIPKLFANEPLVIYLDADLVCHGVDVYDLACAMPSQVPIAGVVDPYIGIPADHRVALEKLDLASARYINSGVLLLRPSLIQTDLLEEFSAFFQEHSDALHPDQDFLNRYFDGRIGELPSKFNYQVGIYERTLFQALSEYSGKIVHYAGKLKPLDGNLAPGMLVFWMYANLVPEITQISSPMRYVRPVKDRLNAIVREPADKPVS